MSKIKVQPTETLFGVTVSGQETTTQPTPGPWKLVSWTDGASWTIEGAQGRLLANVTGQGQAENTANARLIAKAPELLALVKRMAAITTTFGIDRREPRLPRDARALLAELEGRDRP